MRIAVLSDTHGLLRPELDGITFYMVHNKKEIPRNLTGVDVVVFGHSHKYLEERRDGHLFLNPGSCGKRRFNQDITMAVLETGNGEIQVKRIDIPHTDTPVKVPVGTDTRKAVENISRGMKKGENIKDMAKKYGCSPEFTEQVCRIIATHPGVTAEGILNKMEVNRIQNPSCKNPSADIQ